MMDAKRIGQPPGPACARVEQAESSRHLDRKVEAGIAEPVPRVDPWAILGDLRMPRAVAAHACSFLDPRDALPALGHAHFVRAQNANPGAEHDERRVQRALGKARTDYFKAFVRTLIDTGGKALETISLAEHPELMDAACKFLRTRPAALGHLSFHGMPASDICRLVLAAIPDFSDSSMHRVAAFHPRTPNLQTALGRLKQLRLSFHPPAHPRLAAGHAEPAPRQLLFESDIPHLVSCNHDLMAFVRAGDIAGCTAPAIRAFLRHGGKREDLPRKLMEWAAGDRWFDRNELRERCRELSSAVAAIHDIELPDAARSIFDAPAVELHGQLCQFNPRLAVCAQHPVASALQEKAFAKFAAYPDMLRDAFWRRVPGIIEGMLRHNPAILRTHLRVIVEATSGAALAAIDLAVQPELAEEVCRYLEANPHHIGYVDGLVAKDGKSCAQETGRQAKVVAAAMRGFLADSESDLRSVAQAIAECALGHSWRSLPEACRRFLELRDLVSARWPGKIDPDATLPNTLAESRLGIERLAPYVALATFERGTRIHRAALDAIGFDAYAYLARIPEGPRATVAEDLARSKPDLVGPWSFVPGERVAAILERLSPYQRLRAIAAARDAGIDLGATSAKD